MLNKRIAVIVASAFLVACASQEPQVQTGPDAEVIAGNLHKVDHTRGAAYVNPEVDFSQYQQVMIDPLNLDNVEIKQPSSSLSSRGEFTLEPEDKERLSSAYREVFVRELEEDGGYEVVDQAGPNVLRVVASVEGLAPAAAKDDFKSRSIGRSRVYSEGSGSVSMQFVFVDAESEQIVAILQDTRSGSSMWGVNNAVSNYGDVRFMFGQWARQLRDRLDSFQGR